MPADLHHVLQVVVHCPRLPQQGGLQLVSHRHLRLRCMLHADLANLEGAVEGRLGRTVALLIGWPIF
jgi:hypothetical protein